MKMKSSILILCLFILNTLYAGEVVHTYFFDAPKVVNVGNYQKIEFNNTLNTALPGNPVLPYHSVRILVPQDEVAVSVELEFAPQTEIFLQKPLYPQQNVQPVSMKSSEQFVKNERIYNSDKLLPLKDVNEFITSFYNGHAVLLTSVTPIKYNPSKGTAFYSPWVKVIVKTEKNKKSSEVAKNYLPNKNIKTFIDNESMLSQYSTRGEKSDKYELLIITSDLYKNDFNTYRSNYRKLGLNSKLATVETIYNEVAGKDNQEKIRNYIISEYQNYGIEHVLLGGDNEVVPSRGFFCSVQSSSVYSDNSIPSDLYYSSLDGTWDANNNGLYGEPDEDDLLPEVSVARMPFSNTAELASMVNKSYKYMFEPVKSELTKVLLAGEHLYDNPETWGSNYLNILIGERNDNGYTTNGIPVTHPIDSLYEEHQFWGKSDIIANINKGYPMLNHVGHAYITNAMRLTNNDITNENFSKVNGIDHNYTMVYTHGCYCGAFDAEDCIAERMVNINNFASAFIGNSRYGWFNEGQTEGPSAHLHREFVDAMFDKSQVEIGKAHAASKAKTSPWVTAPGQWEPGALRWCFYCCNVLGDPAMRFYTEMPKTYKVVYPENFYSNTASITVNVSENSQPIKDMTCVIIQDDVIIGKAKTNSSGIAEITINAEITSDTLELHVSGKNRIPSMYKMYNKGLGVNDLVENERFRLNIFPNPTSEIANIEIVNSSSNKISYSIYSIDGKLVMNGIKNIESKEKSILNINVKSLQSGTYTFKDETNNLITTFIVKN